MLEGSEGDLPESSMEIYVERPEWERNCCHLYLKALHSSLSFFLCRLANSC